jgi:hypothetical protein
MKYILSCEDPSRLEVIDMLVDGIKIKIRLK